MRPAKLNQQDLEAAVAALEGWAHKDGSLFRQIKFKDFAACFAFMTRVALFAEKTDHHPDWTNVYNRLEIRLSTHDAGGITELDLALARHINKLLKDGL